MSKRSYFNNPLLQINVVEVDDIKFFEVYNLDKPFLRYQTTSISDLLEYIDSQCVEVI